MEKVVVMGKKKNNVVDETVEVTEEVTEETVEPTETLTEEEKLKIENESLKQEIEQLKNDALKAYADAENLKKRIQRDYEQSLKYRIQSFAITILPALDNLERAMLVDDSTGIKDGVIMIYNQIMQALESEGVVPIEALNQPFDPNLHQAMMVETVEGVEPNIVIEELQKGYMLKDRVLRASLVKVSE